MNGESVTYTHGLTLPSHEKDGIILFVRILIKLEIAKRSMQFWIKCLLRPEENPLLIDEIYIYIHMYIYTYMFNPEKVIHLITQLKYFSFPLVVHYVSHILKIYGTIRVFKLKVMLTSIF